MRKSFKEFSCILTGFDHLNKELLNSYFDGLNHAFAADLQETIVIYENLKKNKHVEIEKAIYKAAAEIQFFRTMIKNILALWYLGKLDKVTEITFNPLNHYEALGWKAAQSHPPGLSGGYFGYWHYQPEN